MKGYTPLKIVALVLAVGALTGFGMRSKVPQMNVDTQMNQSRIEEMVFDNSPMMWRERDIYTENNSSKEEIEKVLSMSRYNKNPKFKFNGNGFKIFYSPEEEPIVFEGEASFYTVRSSSSKTATGAPFRDDLPTIAINPGAGINIPALVKLTNLDEGSQGYGTSRLVIANDLGPYSGYIGNGPHKTRIVDMSEETRDRLGFNHKNGVYQVRAEILEEYDLRRD